MTFNLLKIFEMIWRNASTSATEFQQSYENFPNLKWSLSASEFIFELVKRQHKVMRGSHHLHY